ncbi:MAG: serine hydrolase [Verrucomicrobiota bacterium]|jgi:CubicO group peptidase (beta-lactamase class C family)
MTLDRRTFLRRFGLGATGLGLVSTFPACLSAEGALFHAGKLPRGTPEEQGVSSAGILAFLEAVAKSRHEFHSFMMVRHGYVVAEGWWTPYAPGRNHMLYSLSKSFTSTAVGLAVTEGRLKVDDTVTSFFPGDLPGSVSDNLAALRMKHLLTMSAGHATDSTPIITKEENWVKSFLSLPIVHEPGSVFLYNSGATYMLSAIVQKVTGDKLIDYLRPRLFEPLEMKGMSWETCPRGINTGGWGLSVQTECLAKFGQLYLQKGRWKDRQILPAAWVEEATTFKIQQPATGNASLEEVKKTSDWHQGYCYQFWRCRHNGFRGDGAFGQYAIVLPERDAVIAITSESADMQGELNLVWEFLLPALRQDPLPADAPAALQLRDELASLALPPPKGQGSSPTAARVSGKTFQIVANDKGARDVCFRFHGASCTFTLRDAGGEYPIRCGLGNWVEGQTNMPGTPPKITVKDLRPVRIAASGAWKEDNTFEMTWRYYETPHHDTVTSRFDGNKVRVEFMNSITEKSPSHPETRPVLQGEMS